MWSEALSTYNGVLYIVYDFSDRFGFNFIYATEKWTEVECDEQILIFFEYYLCEIIVPPPLCGSILYHREICMYDWYVYKRI